MEQNAVIDWLLEDDNPSVQYRTLVELLGAAPTDPLAQKARQAIPHSAAVEHIFSKMHPDGYWEFRYPRSGRMIGAGVDYFDFITTHFNIAILAELGLDQSDPRAAKAVERYFTLQKPDGDFIRHFSCHYAYLLRAFKMLGYEDHPAVLKTRQLLLDSIRFDDGYLCDLHEGKRKIRPVKSCVRGTLKALTAFAAFPELHQTEQCSRVVNYFLRHRGIYRSDYLAQAELAPDAVPPSAYANTNAPGLMQHEMAHTIFPFVWRAGLLELLNGMALLGYGRREEIQGLWKLLETKKDPATGRYVLDWSPPKTLLPVGKRGAPNKWVTFYALKALKNR